MTRPGRHSRTLDLSTSNPDTLKELTKITTKGGEMKNF